VQSLELALGQPYSARRRSDSEHSGVGVQRGLTAKMGIEDP
jgi:hypothetical protein